MDVEILQSVAADAMSTVYAKAKNSECMNNLNEHVARMLVMYVCNVGYIFYIGCGCLV